ncbi:hypothetical protein BC332_31738 [Capsicum chinense]|nr:hypothetical protein BC332_31738 [Capsicum chinense]
MLTHFAANQNRFVGNIPLGITTYLRNLDLSFNNLNGTMPQDLLSPMNLQLVDLTSNNLEGPIPANISGNKLSGRIPIDISNLNVLELQLGGNQLGGPIPEMLLSLQIALNLSFYLFKGPIPSSLSRLTSLEVLDLSYNRFSGQILDFLARMGGLTRLVLSFNQLSGIVPEFQGFFSVETGGNMV